MKPASTVAAAASRLRLFSLRELAVHRRRTIASVAVMAVSAMYLVAVFGIFGSITGSVNRLSDGIAGIAALEVSGITDAGFPDTITGDVAAVPGVATAAPMIRMSVPTPSGAVLLFGADKSSAELGGALKDAVSRPIEELSGSPDGVQVGWGVGHAKGDKFQLGLGEVTVTDVLAGKELSDLNDGHYVLAPLTLAQNVTGRQGQLDSILITTKPGADLASLRASITGAVNGRAIVADPSMRAARAGDGVKMMNYMALMGAVVALIVGAFLIYTTMTMAITQRRPVISMLRAIGGRRVTIVRDIVAEAAVLGVIGGAIGSGIGILLGRVAIGRLPPAMTQGLEGRVEYWLPGYALPAAVVATVLASVVAAAMAARQVYKVSPIEALAPVGVSAADFVPRWLRIGCGVGAVAVFAASIVIVLGRTGTIAVAAMSALFCAEIALGFALTVPIVKATAAMARLFGSVGALAAATIERSPRRVWATVMTVLIAVAHDRRDHRYELRHDPVGARHLRADRGCGRVGERRLSRQVCHRPSAARSFREGCRGARRGTCHRGRIRVRRRRRHARDAGRVLPRNRRCPLPRTRRSFTRGCAGRARRCPHPEPGEVSQRQSRRPTTDANATRSAAGGGAGLGALLLDRHRHASGWISIK